MKKTKLLLAFILFTAFQSFSQSNSFGWHIILEGTKYKTLMPEGSAFFIQKTIEVKDFKNYAILVGEPILVIDNYKGGVLAFDPQGRLVFIESKSTLWPVTEYQYFTTGSLLEDLSMLDGTVYRKGRYMLIVDQSLDKNTYTVLLGKNSKIEIPMSKMRLVRNDYSNLVDQLNSTEAKFN